jgi:non-ribosomal peptide synthase protein (TIGR01720 family)
VAKIAAADDETAKVTGRVALLPIQRWFLERDLRAAGHWNHVVSVGCDRPLRAEVLRAALDAVVLHHDALRARFERTDAGWIQHLVDDPAPVPIFFGDDHREAPFDLGRPPLLRARLDPGPDAGSTIGLEAHHLVVDAVSWGVILDDLDQALIAIEAGRPVKLPPRTTSLRAFGERLRALAGTERLADDLRVFEEQAAIDAPPIDHDGDGVTEGTKTLTVTLDEAATSELVRDAARIYTTRVDDALLAALVAATRGLRPGDALRVLLERHGRVDLDPDVDLSRTVGWFTSVHPLTIGDPSSERPRDTLRRVKEASRAVPRDGIGYGVLRHLVDDPAILRRVESWPEPELLLNYLGRLDPSGRGGLRMTAPLALTHDPADPSLAPLALDAGIAGGSLRMDWTFRPAIHREATIVALATGVRDALVDLVHDLRHARPGFTPADLDGGVSQSEIDDILEDFAE